MAQQNRTEHTSKGGQALAQRDRDRGSLQSARHGSWPASPFEVIDRMADEMDEAFERMLGGFGMPRHPSLTRSPFRVLERQGLWSPRVEAFQKGDRFIVRAELPGLKKDDVQVDVSDGAITIRGERREEHDEDREGFYHSEREYGHFYRTIALPDGAIAESAQATFKSGVLEVSMQAPPTEASRGRRLEINEGTGEKK